MLGRFFHRGNSGNMPMNLFMLFAIEGALLQFTGSINGFGNNLFATNLGATDAQIGLVQTVPNLVAVALMLPLGILSDRARSSRTVPLFMLLLMTFGYLMMGAVPMMGTLRLPLFFVALGFTVGGPVLYGAQWQNFFGDVVQIEGRNTVLTIRNRFMFIVGIAAPILCGVLMGLCADVEGKLQVLQLFYFLCAAIALSQAAIVSRIPTPIRSAEERRGGFSLKDIGATIKTLAHRREFMGFYVPVVLFYMAWQFDWSMWYIGQVDYLELTETELSIFSGVFNIGQLVAIGILSQTVRRKGTDHTLTYAGLGLITCPVIMVLCAFLPKAVRMTSFTVLVTVLNAPQCAINLCVVQILLRVVPDKCRGLAVSLFTLTTTLTNSFMPYLGVQVYTAMGADLTALTLYNGLTLLMRIGTWALLVRRVRVLRKRGELVIEG